MALIQIAVEADAAGAYLIAVAVLFLVLAVYAVFAALRYHTPTRQEQ